MDLNQIISTLQKMLNKPLENYERRRIIFWEDQEQEFIDDWDSIKLEDVKLQELTNDNQFYIKHLLEAEDLDSSYLIYSNLDLQSEDNWLLDMVLYTQTFKASRIDLIMNELQIDSTLRPTMERYAVFFDNKLRYRKFKSYAGVIESEAAIELRMISALCNLDIPSFERALRTILIETLEDDNKYLEAIKKFFDIGRFWELVGSHYGYTREEKSLKTLFMHLIISALSFQMDEEDLALLENFIALSHTGDCYILIDHWMQNQADAPKFVEYARQIEKEIQLQEIIQELPLEKYENVDIFPIIDQEIILHIASALLKDLEAFDKYLSIIENRRPKYYFEKYENIYDTLFYTIKIFEFRKEFDQGLPQGTAEDIFHAYEKSYYRMDNYYRKFYLAYDMSEKYEFVNKVQEKVEYLYTHWFIGELGANWSQAVRTDLVEDWNLTGVKKQQDFYRDHASSRIARGERIFVIISDAMRYEIATDLVERLNTETIGSTEIEPMLGIVPSITKLGMAALLPYRSLDIDSTGKVMVDDEPIEGYGARKKFIDNKIVNSLVYKYSDYMALNKSEKSETFKGLNLIYIYHDTIDGIGDNSATENRVFNAADSSVSELFNLINSIRNDLSGTNIYVTSDHGFLYQRSPLDESEKIAKELDKPVESSRRYALSNKEQELNGQIRINVGTVLKNENDLQLYIPNGSIRNRIQGPGANFVHGGASLQEVVIPLITFKNRRATQKGVAAVEKVNVQLTSRTRSITNKLFTLQFFQSEKVENKNITRTVNVYMEDENGIIISNIETIIANKTNENSKERIFSKQFALETMEFDRKKDYFLVIKDTETDQYTAKIPFKINLGIINDFF
ncbi:BREX-1 system phosphatase PglZ type A [Ruoffia tabacinasalis]|uniref:BREX-1 system phosphatase PglZ type A n=1 Tax=Ruoffia tabacinasalis TaxID=87458 RepID=UPI0030D3A7F3